MFELALHILDIVQNSIVAGASRIVISIGIDRPANRITVRITDNGRGMDEATVARVTSPFATSRTTRKVGLGIPMLMACAESTGGGLTITSTPGEGTALTASFGLDHIDRPPVGDLAETFASLVLCNPSLDFALEMTGTELEPERMDTADLRAALGEEVPLSSPEVAMWIKESLAEASAPWRV